MGKFKQYRRKGFFEMRPYILGEDLQAISAGGAGGSVIGGPTYLSVSNTDNPPEDMGMIARNPKNHADQWYVARKYFEDNLELVE